ncbi:hypothetical protein EJ04DRAFT_515880 [Polyplosphaeria fusca]|uniref:Uncharacterized protein n=1 Tax=Polyplosphaeria fusca TaxID=682080 RepID=A0A9P4UYS4_9PLEO|nr:hypothetical protein EJ04DRAFT_515880 [Polyplosphaeria fusca]
MPPRIPVRFVWPSRPSPAFINAPRYLRSFTSTRPSRGLGPESPNYIEVPKTVQPSFTPKPRIKGVLPTPRDVFKVRSRQQKQSPRFMRRLTQEKMEKNIKPISAYDPDRDYRLYKRRLTAIRKESLREGVRELHERKTSMEAQQQARTERNTAARRALVYAPRKQADVLTENTMQRGLRDYFNNTLKSSSRSEISNRRRVSFQSRIAKQAAVRQARLHDLYINAREFIVDEEQLDEAIEKAFGTEDMPVRFDERGNVTVGDTYGQRAGDSPWSGPMPDGVGELLDSLKTGSGVGLAKERMKKVAEELTGGKM